MLINFFITAFLSKDEEVNNTVALGTVCLTYGIVMKPSL
jgi:hypothetical protein